MKLLVICDLYPPYHSGGYELRCKNVIDRLNKIGHTAIVLSTRVAKQNGNANLDGKNIYRGFHSEDSSKSLFRRIITDIQDVKFLDNSVKNFQPEVIYLWHTINLTRAIYPYLAEKEIPVVYDEGGQGLTWAWQHHGPWYTMVERKSNSTTKNWMKTMAAILLSTFSGNLFKTRWVWPEINAYFNSETGLTRAEKMGVPLRKVKVIHSGIDLNTFTYRSDDWLVSPIRIVTPGRFVPQKRLRDSIILVEELNKRNIPVELTIVGKIGSKTCFNEIDQLIRDDNLGGFINILPFLTHDEIARLYHKTDFCFFPSCQEFGFSRIPIEAMACGSMIFSYGNEGSDEIIKNGETGFIIPEGNISVAADTIAELMNDPARYQKIIRAARYEIDNNFSMDHYIDNIEAFLLECVK